MFLYLSLIPLGYIDSAWSNIQISWPIENSAAVELKDYINDTDCALRIPLSKKNMKSIYCFKRKNEQCRKGIPQQTQ